jgi:hypothetical protein
VRVHAITKALAAIAAATAVTVPAVSASADTPTPSTANTPAARSATGPAHYAGLWMPGKGGNWWVGSDKVRENGRTVIVDCVIPGAELLTPAAVRTGIYGSKRQSAELAYIMASWGTSSSGSVAAGARLAMLKIVGRPIPGLRVPAKIAAYARNDLLNAERYAGPDKASVTFTHEPTTPGQPGTAVFTVTSATGHPVTVPSQYTATAAAIIDRGQSGTPVRFTRTGTSPVRVTATATVTSGQVTIGTAPHGQTLIGALAASVTASAGYQARPAAVRSTVACNCDGTGNVTATVTQAAGAAEGRYAMFANGIPDGSVTLAASRHGQAARIENAATVTAGAVITFTVSYKIGGRWTAPASLGGTFTVICPAMPALTQKCACSLALSLANPLPKSSPYTESLVYSIAGKTYTVAIPAGGSKSVPLGITSGSVTYYAEVQRNGKIVATTPKMIGGFA